MCSDTSVLVLIDLRFCANCLCCLHPFSGSRVAAFWKIAAHSDNDMFSKYKHQIFNLYFPTSVFAVGMVFFLIA